MESHDPEDTTSRGKSHQYCSLLPGLTDCFEVIERQYQFQGEAAILMLVWGTFSGTHLTKVEGEEV